MQVHHHPHIEKKRSKEDSWLHHDISCYISGILLIVDHLKN